MKIKVEPNKFGVHLLLFIIFAFVYYYFIHGYIEKIVPNDLPVSPGILFTISGIWGFAIDDVLLKLPCPKGKSKWVNIPLMLVGLSLLIYSAVKMFF